MHYFILWAQKKTNTFFFLTLCTRRHILFWWMALFVNFLASLLLSWHFRAGPLKTFLSSTGQNRGDVAELTACAFPPFYTLVWHSIEHLL